MGKLGENLGVVLVLICIAIVGGIIAINLAYAFVSMLKFFGSFIPSLILFH